MSKDELTELKTYLENYAKDLIGCYTLIAIILIIIPHFLTNAPFGCFLLNSCFSYMVLAL